MLRALRSFVLLAIVLLCPRSWAEDQLDIHITDGEIYPNGFSCKEARLKDWLYDFVARVPTVRISGATIQLRPAVSSEFYDPTYVWRDGPVWMAWFRSNLPATVVIVRIDPSRRVPTAKIAVVEHSADRDCGEIWTGAATRSPRALPKKPGR